MAKAYSPSAAAEIATAGAMIIAPAEVAAIVSAPELAPEDFANPLAAAVCQGWAAGTVIDVASAIDAVAGVTQDIAAAEQWISKAIDMAPTIHSYPTHARRVKQASTTRSMIRDVRAALAAAEADADPVALGEALNVAASIADGSDTGADIAVHSRDVVAEWLHDLDNEVQAGIYTGIDIIDEQMDPLTAGDLMIIAAHPGVGKSAIAQQIATYVARDMRRDNGDKMGVLYVSLEMTGEQLVTRAMSAATDINGNVFRRRALTDHHLPIIAAGAAINAADNIWYCCNPSITVESIRREARRRAKEIDLIVVDYLQILTIDLKTHGNNIYLAYEAACKNLKAIGSEIGVPIILLSQLDKASEKSGGIPRLADVKGGNGIKATASHAIVLARESEDVSPDGTVRVCCLLDKQRFGQPTPPNKPIMLDFSGGTSTFSRAADQEYHPENTNTKRREGFLHG